VVLEDEMLARILDSGLSFDATAGFDILGARQTTDLDTMTHERPVLAFSDGVGAMAGVAFHGGVLRVNEGLTAAYHGGEAGGSADILKGAHAPGLEAFELWSALVVDSPGAGAPQIVRP
jgi:lipid-binding SYLF domain-containing protein